MIPAGTARRFARLALAGLQREFPYNPGHVLRNARDLKRPRELHPAFHGCFDWHSAAHGHWLLLHLLRTAPRIPEAASIGRLLERRLTLANMKAEARYLENHPSFERPYGWVWALKLAEAAQGTQWERALAPLAGTIEARYREWLPRQTYPIRSGTHANTAFGLAFALDYARAFRRRKLERLLVDASRSYFEADVAYPARWEPGGNDFLSPCLIEADLMRRILPSFARWLGRFLPQLPRSLREPAVASDRADGQLAHLDGLNLSRAACLYSISGFSTKRRVFLKAADRHLAAGLAHVESGSYAGEHWLASFGAWALGARNSSAR